MGQHQEAIMHLERPMLFQQSAVRMRVKGIIRVVAIDEALHEDLLQAAIIHLWQVESRKPDQNLAWYLRSCHLHVLGLIDQGRSVDSIKRRLPHRAREENAQERALPPDHVLASDNVLEEVSAKDFLAQLCPKLDLRNQVILHRLAEGFTMREIAGEIHVSHPAVVKRRRQIASVAVRLGFYPECWSKTTLRGESARRVFRAKIKNRKISVTKTAS